MGSHKRSFQSFDAILDDPSLKPSLSYGHRSAASHMSSPASNRLDPLEDRGCYLCADHQQATSMTSEASGAYSTPWYHFQTHPHSHRYMTRRPARPEETAGEFEDHHFQHHKLGRRIVLVKNSDPSVRKTIVLHRRSLCSLGLFMDEVSELMQCLIRKLYTLDGQKVDNVQSLLHCAGILVCVGREPFHPLLLDSFRKNSNDKLPKLNMKSRSSVGSDDNGAKKNVNFGHETKRSIVHPRCDSSNRSAQKVSSEKLFNSLPPRHAGTCPRAREDMMDDDIEKRVLVNKDGSLSMEMKVHFRLQHDETLHWSTEIKKSTSTVNKCPTAHDDAYCISHGSAESCSEVESLSAGEAEETYNTKHYQKHFEESNCYHRCAQCQEYDMWKKPILPDQTAMRHIRSSSSSASSHKIVCKKASSDSVHTMSSEEYTEHVVEKVEQTFGKQSDTSIKHCTIHCCCRKSQVCLVSAKSTGSTEQKYKVSEKMEVSENDENKPDNCKDSQKGQLTVRMAQSVVEDERPVSTVSSSSQILASLKEDQDEEDVDIIPSISRASLDSGQQEDEDDRDSEFNPCSVTPCRSCASMTHLSPKPPNKTSPMGRSKMCRKLTPTEKDVDQDYQNVRAGSAESAPSEALSGPHKCKCSQPDDIEINELMPNDQQEEDAELKIDVNIGETKERTHSEMSAKSKTSTKSPSKLSLCSQDDTASENNEEHQDITDERSTSGTAIKSNESGKSKTTSVKSKISKISKNDFEDLAKSHDNVEERMISSMSCKSNISSKSNRSNEPQPEEKIETDEHMQEKASGVKSAMSNRSGIEDLKDQTDERASSALSLKSNTSDRSKMSVELSELEEHEEDIVSVHSHDSQKSKSEISEASSFQVGEEGELQERTGSAMSATSVQSLKTTLSDVLQATTVEPHNSRPKERAQSVISTKSCASVKVDLPEEASQVESELPEERSPSSMSSISHISATSKVSKGDQEQFQAEDKEEFQERASSAISAKSNISLQSRKSETTPTAIERPGEEIKERTLSAMSSKSKASLRSNKSKVSSVAPEEHVDTGETGKRASSTMSAKSEVSTDVELEQGASSAISAKSNASETSKRSKMSKVGEDEHKKLQVQDDDRLSAVSYNSETLNTSNEWEKKEKRTPSALSTKSKTSVKSKKSKASDLAAVKIVAEEHYLRSASAMSSKSISAKSEKSEVSQLVIEDPVKIDDQKEGTQSAISAKSNEYGISVVTDDDEVADDRSLRVMSSKSNASKRSKKIKSTVEQQTVERAQSALSAKTNVSQKLQTSNASAIADNADDKEKEERVPIAMSEESCISTKSEASKISEESLQEPFDTEFEDKTPSVMSIKSSVSARSHKSTNSYGGPAEVDIHNNDRPLSAISSLSNISTKSVKSITSEATYSEKETPIEPYIKERALSVMSAKSNSSVRTSTLKVSEIIIDEPNDQKVERASSSKSLKSNASGRAKKLTNVSEASPKNVVNEDNEKEERAASVLSSLSNVSERTKHSEIIPDVIGSHIEERAPTVASVTSVKSKSSNISGVVPEETEITSNKDAEASVNSSNVLGNANASTRSKSSFSEDEEHEERSISVLSRASVESKVSKADLEKQSNRSTSQLSAKSDVSAKCKKSKVSGGKDNTTSNRSPVSGHSKVCQADSNKCFCGAVKLSPTVSSEKDSHHEEIPASPQSTKSGKSKISSAGTTSERALTPTSTSVSIGIVDDCEDDDVEKIDEGTTSVKSKTSASSETYDKSKKVLLESPLQMTNDRATHTPEERPKSFTSAKSNISERLISKYSHCTATWLVDRALDTNQRDEPSANDSVRQNSPTQVIRSSNKASSLSVSSCTGISEESTAITGQWADESQDVSHESQRICSKCSSTKNRGKTALVAPTSPVSSASAVLDSKGSAEIVDRPNSIISNSSNLQVNNQKMYVELKVNSGDSHSGKSKKSCKSTQTSGSGVRCHSATLSVTSTNRRNPCPPKSPQKSQKTVILRVGSKDSVLSQTVPDQSGENTENKNMEQPKTNRPDKTHNGRPDTTDSIRNVSDNKSEKSSKCRKRIGSSFSSQIIHDDAPELSPSCLPNASPTEVVNEWLMNIPSDTALFDLEDEFHDNFDTTEPLCTSHVPSGDENEHRDLKDYYVTKPEKQNNVVDDAHLASAEGTIDRKTQENHAVCENDRHRIRPQAGEESKVLDSSVLVMKVLLSPKIDRCNSLPEVSPVYGRKLSTSAQGLLDCLAKLQLLDFGPSDDNRKKAKYQELMSMLKSLWLCDPKGSENFKDQQPLDEEFKARSSSGVDVNSGSTSSGKSSVLGGAQAQTNAECEVPDTLTKVQEVDETVQEEPSETPESKCKSATPYISSRAKWTPEGGAKGPVDEKLKGDVTGSDETIRSNDSPRELMETPLSSNKSSGNHPQNKEPETDHPEDSSSGSRSASQRPQLSKMVSQDPDPIWLVNLLNKLEKQFMTHYVNAMDEFKVRWNLDDNEQIDVMIWELQDEVRKRIQCSVNRELKKIRGRAGRPRPPKEDVSRESTVQTEQRRRRLKVMRNQSVDPHPAKSEDEYTATGTDFSDQRSDDEYCPCDTCLKNKIASKPVLPVEMLNSAPVMMDFDLRRILQIKKSTPNKEKTESDCKVSKMDDAEENLALEAVKEEDDSEVKDASTAQEIEKEDDNDRKSDDCEKKDDTFQKKSDTSLKKDMNEEVEVISGTEVVEQQKNINNADESEDGQMVDEKIAGNEKKANVESVDVAESTSVKSVGVEQTAGETETVEDETAEEGMISEVKNTDESETAEDETAEEGEISQVKNTDESEKAEDENAEEGEISEVKTADESGTAEDDTAEEGEISEVKTAEESGTAEDETAEEGEISEVKTADESGTAEDDTAEEGEISEVKTADESGTAEDDTAEEGEISEVKTADESDTAEDDTAEEGEISEVKTADESETAEDETAEEGEISKVKTADESDTAEDETAEEGEISEVKTADESDTAEDDTAEEGEMPEVKTADESGTAEDDTAEEGEISKVKTADESDTAEDETAEEGEISEVKTADESETAEDDTAEEGEISEVKTADESGTAEDDTAEEGEIFEVKTADESGTAEDDTAEEGEISEVKTADESETAEDETAEEGEISEVKTAYESKTAEDETAEEGEISEVKTADESETAEDDTAEEGEISEVKTADESETAEDDTAEEGEISEVKTADESGTAEDETAEEGEISEVKTAEESETAEDETAEEGEISEVKTADKIGTAEDDTAEEGEISEVKTADESETAEDEIAEQSETAEDETAEEGAILEDKTAEGSVTAENETAEKTEEDGETSESETAEEETAEKSETVANETAEDEQNSEDETAEKSETTEDETAKDEQTTEDETAEKSETAKDESAEDGETASHDTQEEHKTSKNASVEDDKTAGESDTAAEEQTAQAKSAKETETLDEETATNGQSAESESAEEDKTAKDEQNVGTSARNRQTSDHETTNEVEPFVKDGQPAKAETADESETADEETAAEKDDSEGETIDEDTNSTDNKDELVEERVAADDKSTDEDKETDRAETADEETTEAVEDVSSRAEEDLTEDEENAGEDLSEQKKSAEEDTHESHSEHEEVDETVYRNKDVLSNPDDTEYDDVIDLKADQIVAEEETLFKNEGDVVIDSIDETAKESGKEYDAEDIQGCHFADIGESAEGGDEAEDDTEPDMEVDEGEHDGNVQVSQSTLLPKQEDDKPDKTTVTSFDVAVNNNLVYDADVEDSETEVNNQIQELSSEAESKPHKTVRKTFKMLIHTLAFLQTTATLRPKARENEEGDDEVEHKETPEESDNTEDSSVVEKEECGKEKGKLSDITEDTGEEENHETETGNSAKDDSEESEWESSENALEKQFTKSSIESQPGSFDEVLDDQVKSQESSNHVTVKAKQ